MDVKLQFSSTTRSVIGFTMLDLIRRGLEELERENQELHNALKVQKREYEAKLAEIKASFQDQYKQKVRTLKRQIENVKKFKRGESIEEESGDEYKLQDHSRNKRRKKEVAIIENEDPVYESINEPIKEPIEDQSPKKSLRKSPSKVLMYQGKPFNRHEFTDSEFNMLPTQYSLQVSVHSPDRPVYVKLSSSPMKDFVEDSQDIGILAGQRTERKPLQETTTHNIQKPTKETKLQRREMQRKRLEDLLQDEGFVVDLTTNPITESSWCLTDFKPNDKYGIPIEGPASRVQLEQISAFNRRAGGPTNEIPESQMYDKFPSPPGFMTSEFPSTQEALERQRVIRERQEDRVNRRLKLSLEGGEFVFYESVLNQYVEQGRYRV